MRFFGGLFVLFLWNCKIEAKLDIDYTKESKILGVSQHYVYQLFHDEMSFEEAEEECDDRDGGHLVTIADQMTMTKIADGLFEADLLDEDSTRFFWMGLQWNDSWFFTAGNPSGWSISKYSNWDDDPQPDENEEKCVGINFQQRGKFKWHPEKCDVKAPYICQILNDKCLPWIETGPGQLMHMDKSKSNYGCARYKGSMTFIINQCQCLPPERNITIESKDNSCDDTHMDYFWHDKVCVPGCRPKIADTPKNALLLDVSGVFFAGGRVDYYCPGYFEYDGQIHPHNLFQMPCLKNERFKDTLAKLKCHPEDPDDVNKDVQQLDGVVGHNYHLKCGYKGSPDFKPKECIWYRNGERVYSGTSRQGTSVKVQGALEDWVLKIDNLAEDRCGMYMCLATFGTDNTIFVPGKLYNVSVEQFLKAQAALKTRNEVITAEKFAGYYVNADNTYSSLQALSMALPWAEAKAKCEDGPGGHLVRVNGSLAFPLLRNFFSASLLDIRQESSASPNFYWVGDQVNRVSGQLTDTMFGPRGPVLPVDDRVIQVTTGDPQCVGVRLNSRGRQELARGNCNRRAPFICSFHAQQCLPPDVVRESLAEDRNYLCDGSHNTTLDDMAADACECTPTDETFDRRQIDGHKSCNHEATWTTTLCLPWCSPDEVHESLGKLVKSSAYHKDYYKGMVMTYFCGGHFEVNGSNYAQSSIEVACDPGNGNDEAELAIKCKPEFNPTEDDSLDIIYFEPDKTEEVMLPCEHHIEDEQVQPNRYIWMHNKNALVPRSKNTSYFPHYDIKDSDGALLIQKPNKESAGVYMCFADFDGLLVPGAVHKLRTMKHQQQTDEIKEDDETTEDTEVDVDSSGTSVRAFQLPWFAFFSAALFQLLLMSVLLC